MHDEEFYNHLADTAYRDCKLDKLPPDSSEILRFSALVPQIPAEAHMLLDVGCGTGVLLHYLKRHRPALRAVGVERSDPLAEIGRHGGVEIVTGDADDLPFADATFDVATACEVLEHLPLGVYDRAREELQRVAQETILVTVPFRERRISVRCPYCGCRFDPNYHIRVYDERTLGNLFTQFSLTRLVPIFVTDSLLDQWGPRAWVRWLRGVARNYPEKCVCPQCGYFRPPPTALPGGSASAPPAELSWQKRLSAWLPRVRKPYWVLAVYRRHTPLPTVAPSPKNAE